MHNLVHVGAIVYGLLLVLSLFVRSPVTEALRIDTLFLPKAGEHTRLLNPLLGLCIAGYGAWSLFGA